MRLAATGRPLSLPLLLPLVVGVVGASCSLLNPLDDLTGGITTAAGVSSGGGGGASGGSSPVGGAGGEAPCPAGEKRCEGDCVRIDDALFGCAAAGCDPCAFDHAVAVCSGGECAMSSCLVPYADCDGLPDNGCEANLAADAHHCTECGRSCDIVGGTGACEASVCVVGSCDSDHEDCDEDVATGCEVNTSYDPANCDSCGYDCSESIPGSPVCNDGTCEDTSCAPGTADCGGAPNDCETDTTSDPNHCGFCNNPCNYPHGVGTCVASVCTLDSCTAPYANCDGQAGNGCETDLNQSTSHCGQCNHGCEGGACVGGTCRPVAIALGEHGPLGITTADGKVYWTNFDGNEVRWSDVVTPTPKTLAENQKGPMDIAVGGGYAYWSNSSDHTVMSVPLGGSGIKTVADNLARPRGVAVSHAFVFLTDGAQTEGSVLRAPFSGGVSEVIALNEHGPMRVTTTDDRVLWTDYEDGAIVLAKADGGDRTALTKTNVGVHGIHVATDGWVYWTNVLTGEVWKITLDGQGQKRLATGQDEPRSPVSDDTYLYWVTRTEVVRSLLAGGPVEVLIDSLKNGKGLASDASRLFVTDYDAGSVLKLVKEP